MIGSLQQNDDAARLEFVWQLVEMNDADTGDTVPKRLYATCETNRV
jgi:hypothetical protein